MPIQAQLDTGFPGRPAPLEGADESKSAGIAATMQSALTSSLGVTGIEKVMAATAGGPHVSHDEAAATMKAQGYDTSGLPAEGLTQGALNVMMQRQSDLRVNASIAQRANLGTVSRFTASLAGGSADPINAALLPFAPALRGGMAARAVTGAAVGGGYTAATTYGEQAIGHTLGDQDQSSMDNLRQVLFGTVVGGGLHVGFGGKKPVVKMPDATDMRATIFDQVAKAEDATGKGIVTVDTGGVTKFGISQKAHPDVDVANLTKEAAAKILKSDYWDKIGGDKLDPSIQHTAMDAAVNQGVENANKWLKESGGDPVKFNQLRAEHYKSLAAANPEKYGQYLNGWLKRLENVANEPILAADMPPRVQSTDTMGANVDELPPETRSAALETAVNQYLRDDEVNVTQVINKSLEEHWGVKPDSDFDPTGGAAEEWGRQLTANDNGPRSALTLQDEHDQWVMENESRAFAAVGRRLQGADTDISQAIPVAGRAMVKQADLDRIAAVKEAAQAQPVKETETKEGPLTAEAKASTGDVVSEAKQFFPAIGKELPAEFENLMAHHDEVIADHEAFADGIEAAVRCAAQLGVD